MNKVKVFLGVRSKSFAKRIKKLTHEVEIVGESASFKTINGNLSKAEFLIIDMIPPMRLNFVNTSCIFVNSEYNSKKEFLAAKAGAKGFITKDISDVNLIKAIKSISSGEIWMTRNTISRVFEEYRKILSMAVESPCSKTAGNALAKHF